MTRELTTVKPYDLILLCTSFGGRDTITSIGGNAANILLPKGIDLDSVEEAIESKNWLLRFPPKLETMFERETGKQRCHELIIRAYIGIIIYDLFAIADWWATPELFSTALRVRLVFFTPLALTLTVVLYLSPPVFIREGIMCIGGGALATVTILYLMAVSGNEPQATLHQSMILVVLFLTVVQRIRFLYLAPTCLAFLALHAFSLEQFYDYSIGQQVAINMVFGGSVIFALIASYTMERDLRLHYLLSLRGRIQHQELDMMSRRDALTGLGNRRSLEEILELCEQSAGAPGDFSIVLLDIDHFKLFNDTAGHRRAISASSALPASSRPSCAAKPILPSASAARNSSWCFRRPDCRRPSELPSGYDAQSKLRPFRIWLWRRGPS